MRKRETFYSQTPYLPRFVNSPISVGIIPVKLLLSKYRNLRFVALPIAGLTAAEKLLPESPRNLSLVVSNSSHGIFPWSRLFISTSVSNFFHMLKFAKKVPLSWFSWRFRNRKLLVPNRVCGSFPVSVLLYSPSCMSFRRYPMAVGIVPVRWLLFLRMRFSNEVMRHNSDGIVPERPKLSASMC